METVRGKHRYKLWFALSLGFIFTVQSLGGSAVGAPALPPAEPGQRSPEATNTLILRGLDKISGQPTDIVAPIGRQVAFATLRITARYCYSTPPSETPQTVAFLQIDDIRPDELPRRVFSGWMYASNPGLNGMDHPLYDVWVVTCRASAPNESPTAIASIAPAKVHSPDATDSESSPPLPKDMGR